MKHYTVPIFTDKYFVDVYLGKTKELDAFLKKTLRANIYEANQWDGKHAGKAFNCFPKYNPFIIIDSSLPYFVAVGTVAHEASHALDYIAKHLGLNDESGEFRAYGIGEIVSRIGMKDFKK